MLLPSQLGKESPPVKAAADPSAVQRSGAPSDSADDRCTACRGGHETPAGISGARLNDEPYPVEPTGSLPTIFGNSSATAATVPSSSSRSKSALTGTCAPSATVPFTVTEPRSRESWIIDAVCTVANEAAAIAKITPSAAGTVRDGWSAASRRASRTAGGLCLPRWPSHAIRRPARPRAGRGARRSRSASTGASRAAVRAGGSAATVPSPSASSTPTGRTHQGK